MALLDANQLGELWKIIPQILSVAELDQLLLVRLNIRLFVDASTRNKPGSEVAYDLIMYCERVDRTDELLRVLITERPRNVPLRTLISQLKIDQPPPVARPDTTGLADKFGKGISQLPTAVGSAPSPRLLIVLGGLLERLRSCSDQLRWLSQYKGLHEALHKLQELLGAIGTAARDYARSRADKNLPPPADDLAADCLSRYLFDLQKLVAEAQKRVRPAATNDSIAPILSIDEEKKWIDVFADIVSGYAQALASNDAPGITSSVERLRALLRKSHDLNQHLLEVARMLSLPELGKVLQKVLDLMSNTAATEFKLAVDAVNQLGPDLGDLVNEHDNWQQLELVFALGESQGAIGVYFEDWPSVKGRLVSLCMINAGDPLAKLLLAATNDFGASVPTGSVGYLRHAFRGMFHEVDRRLLDLTEELAAQAKKLSTATQQLADMLSA